MSASKHTSGRGERAVDALYNHLVLPPRLPSSEDPDVDGISKVLNQRAREAAKHMSNLGPSLKNKGNYQARLDSLRVPITEADLDEVKRHLDIWKQVALSLERSQNLIVLGHIDRQFLKDALRTMLSPEDDSFIVLHVAKQNCGVLIHQRTRYV
jgi:ribosomal protein S30